MSTNPNLVDTITATFYDNTTPVSLYFIDTKVPGPNFDPERNDGYIVTLQNPVTIQAIVRDIQPERLVLKEMGLTESGAIELLIKAKDLQALQIAEKIIYFGVEYYKYNDAIGKKFLIWKRPFGYYRVWLFRKEK